MIKNLPAAIIAMSVVAVAQSASAQNAPYALGTKQDVTLAAVYPVFITSGTPAVKLTDGKIWIFKQIIGTKVDGKAVLPTDLKPGLKCVLNGMPGLSKAYSTILSLDCKTN